jgi:hypothetical protein
MLFYNYVLKSYKIKSEKTKLFVSGERGTGLSYSEALDRVKHGAPNTNTRPAGRRNPPRG